MGNAISRIMDDFVALTEADYQHHNFFPDHVVIVDISDILEEMHSVIVTHGETPVYEHLNHHSMSSFLFDIYNEIGYLPDGKRFVARNTSSVLDTVNMYFDCTSLSPLQRQSWLVATQKIIDRFVSFKLYNQQNHIHNYDFHLYEHGTLYLKKP